MAVPNVKRNVAIHEWRQTFSNFVWEWSNTDVSEHHKVLLMIVNSEVPPVVPHALDCEALISVQHGGYCLCHTMQIKHARVDLLQLKLAQQPPLRLVLHTAAINLLQIFAENVLKVENMALEATHHNDGGQTETATPLVPILSAPSVIRFPAPQPKVEDARYLDEVSDLLQATLPDAPYYTTLKWELINRLSRSRDSEIRQLLSREEIVDHTPSQFLRHLRNLIAKSEIPDNILRSLWEGRLPVSVQVLLATLDDAVFLNDVAKLADKVHETHNSKRVVAISASKSNIIPDEWILEGDSDMEKHEYDHFLASKAGVKGSGSTASCTARRGKDAATNKPNKLMKRNRRKCLYKEQPWPCKPRPNTTNCEETISHDYMDAGILEGLQHRLLTITRHLQRDATTEAQRQQISQGNHLAIKSKILAKRVETDGTTKVLVHWVPEDMTHAVQQGGAVYINNHLQPAEHIEQADGDEDPELQNGLEEDDDEDLECFNDSNEHIEREGLIINI
ncbi:hypothetical protein B566_EDAN001487 [Ephemera danica]|nr:hypothetical protein B566_EDAN001487 [Ephemera danica]